MVSLSQHRGAGRGENSSEKGLPGGIWFSWAQVFDALLELCSGEPTEAQAHVVLELVFVNGHGLTTSTSHLSLGFDPNKVAAFGFVDLQSNLPQLLADQLAPLTQVH
eukprot:Skav216162  [mRNA]  locus=scaffold3788:182642:182962:- [translate_table: standard]